MILTIIFFVLKGTNKFENAKNIILFEKKLHKIIKPYDIQSQT